jgi:hypothetical protein
MGPGTPSPSYGRPQPPRQPTLLETHAPALGYQDWDPQKVQYDWWEKEFIEHCCRKFDKWVLRDRDWFLEKGFRSHMLDKHAKIERKMARRRRIENIRKKGREEYKREMELGFPELKRKRYLWLKVLILSVVAIVAIIPLASYFPDQTFVLTCGALQWVAIIAFIFMAKTFGNIPRCPECMSIDYKQRFLSSYTTCARCGYRERVYTSPGGGYDGGGGGCCGE